MSREILRAILKGDVAKLDALISEGGDVTEITENEKWSYLHRAFLSITMPPPAQTVQNLVNRGLDVNAIDTYGNTPIHYAARLKKAELVELLVNAGADVNIVNLEGVSPLRQLLLSRPYDYQSIKFLIQSGADIYQKVDDGLSVKDFAKTTANGDQELLAIFDSH